MHILIFILVYFLFRAFIEIKGWKFIYILILVLCVLPILATIGKVLLPNILALSKGVTPCDCIDNYNLGYYDNLVGKDLEVRKKCNEAYDGVDSKIEDAQVCFWHELK